MFSGLKTRISNPSPPKESVGSFLGWMGSPSVGVGCGRGGKSTTTNGRVKSEEKRHESGFASLVVLVFLIVFDNSPFCIF